MSRIKKAQVQIFISSKQNKLLLLLRLYRVFIHSNVRIRFRRNDEDFNNLRGI